MGWIGRDRSEIREFLKSRGQAFVDEFSPDVVDVLTEITQEELYDNHDEGEYYDRTGDVLNSIKEKQSWIDGNKYSREIGFDTSSIGLRPKRWNSGKKHMMFGAHMNLKNHDVRTLLFVLQWLEEGHAIFDKEPYEGAHMIAKTKEYIRSAMNEQGVHAYLSKGAFGLIVKKKI